MTLAQRSPALADTWVVCLLAAMVVALPQGLSWKLDHSAVSTPVTLALPDLPGTGATHGAEPLLTPFFTGSAAQATRVYGEGNAAVTVHVAYYRRQGYGGKMVSSTNALIQPKDHTWNRVATGRTTQAVGDRELALRTAELIGGGTGSTSGRKRLDVRQTYWSGGRFTISDHWATLLTAVDRLAGKGDDGAVITFYTEGEAAVTTPRLTAFIGSHLPALEAHLSAVRNTR